MINLLALDRAGLVALFADLGEKPFRAKQVSHWLHQRLVDDVSAMTDLSKGLRERLAKLAEIRGPKVISDTTASDGTRKWLLDVGAANAIEMVYIPEDDRFASRRRRAVRWTARSARPASRDSIAISMRARSSASCGTRTARCSPTASRRRGSTPAARRSRTSS
jgi:adenine C2-methylase RlmN of 23S rRNA A2503 and tRNA A37